MIYDPFKAFKNVAWNFGYVLEMQKLGGGGGCFNMFGGTALWSFPIEN